MAAKKDPSVFFPLLLEAFREEPGNVHRAAQHAGVTWPTASRAWEQGSKRHGFGPIKAIIAEEQRKARSLIEAERAAARAMRAKEIAESAESAIKSRKQEGQMVELTRGSALSALTAVIGLSKGSRKLAEVMANQIAVEITKLEQWTAYETSLIAGDPNAPNLLPAWSQGADREHPPSLNFLLTILNRSADYAAKIASVAERAMEMERLHLGEPIEVIRHEHTIKQDISPEELEIRRQNANAVLDQAARKLRVVEGGKPAPLIGQRVVIR